MTNFNWNLNEDGKHKRKKNQNINKKKYNSTGQKQNRAKSGWKLGFSIKYHGKIPKPMYYHGTRSFTHAQANETQSSIKTHTCPFFLYLFILSQ